MEKLVVVADFDKQAVNLTIDMFRSWVSKRAKVIAWFQNPQSLRKIIYSQKIDCILVFGGDGLLLSTARQLEGQRIPVVGINFGKLGFLTELTKENMTESLEKIFAGHYRVVGRMMLKCDIIRNNTIIDSTLALNEGVIRTAQAFRLLYCKLCINNEVVSTYGGDGVIVSTPTGSTAYSLSAGGPIVSPSLPAFVITPICPHTLTIRPLVVSSDELIEIRFAPPFPGDAIFSVDGQVSVDLQENDSVRITQAESKFYLLETGKISFFTILREKLAWGNHGLKTFL